MPLTQKSFQAEVGDGNVIWVNPAKVPYLSGSKWPVGKYRLRQLNRYLPLPIVNLVRHNIKQREPFLVPAQHFGQLTQIAQTPRYLKIADFIEHKDDVTASQWCQDLLESLKKTGVASHKNIQMRSEAEVLEFFDNYVGALVNSLQTEGYVDPDGGYESTAVINQNGMITKTGSGNHRFCMSAVLELDRFPLRIVAMHENWQPVKDLGPSPSADSILKLIPAIEAAHR